MGGDDNTLPDRSTKISGMGHASVTTMQAMRRVLHPPDNGDVGNCTDTNDERSVTNMDVFYSADAFNPIEMGRQLGHKHGYVF